MSVQPKEGGSQGGETRESVVYALAEDMLEKLPKQYNSFEVKEALQRMGALLPMNIFLRQEIDRIQRVLKEVYSTLTDLKLAIDGTIVMSQNLRTSLDAMYDARIPERWQKVTTRSSTYILKINIFFVVHLDFLGINNFRFLVYGTFRTRRTI